MMGGLKTVIGGIVIDKLLTARPAAAGSNKSYHIMVAFAGLFVVIALVFVLIALYHTLSAQFEPNMAALITAGASLGIALITVLAAHTVREYHRPKIQRHANEVKTQIETMLKGLEGEWDRPIREHPKTSIALATIVGYLLGDRIA